MPPSTFTENTVEQAALAWLEGLGYEILAGQDISPGGPQQLRDSYSDVILEGRLRQALGAINSHIPSDVIDDVVCKVSVPIKPDLYEDNRAFHQMLVNGVDVEYAKDAGADGSIRGDKVWLIDFEKPSANHFSAINQFTVIENKHNRRPDIVVFVNGLPLAVMELKNAVNENATIHHAFNQLQTYKKEIPSLFRTNAVLVIADGTEARAGSLTADRQRFMPWRTIDGVRIAPRGSAEMEALLKGLFVQAVLLDMIQSFTVFEADGASLTKKIAAYHQYHAVNKAVECTLSAAAPQGDKRVGVIWHTQGSGKSLSMIFYAGKIIQARAMQNPTLVVLTDRNDLDDQLFGTFCASEELLRQTPVQARSRNHLQGLLSVASGGVVFTTIQKFGVEKGAHYPVLSNRSNIVVIVDEAHRSQYDFIDGFARALRDALPNAAFIGFTGTPIALTDRDTYAVFGDNIHTYDIMQAVEDGATVRIYYESRLAKLALDEEARPHLEADFEELTEGEEHTYKQQLKNKWARLEALVGATARIRLVAEDLLAHLALKLAAVDGKAMAVCMSRRICVDLYDAIIRLRPAWHDDDDRKGMVKLVMTGSAADPQSYRPHIRNKSRRDLLARRARDPSDPLQLIIVRDMWLTGFDAPPMHTLYIDKPMKGHNLMQAIARVNRVFKDKSGGLIVDYLGIADSLRQALASYTQRDREQTAIPIDEAIAIMLTKYEGVKQLFHGLDYWPAITGTAQQKVSIIPAAMEHILALEDGRARFMQLSLALSKAFALCAASDEAREIRDEVGFFQGIRAALSKSTAGSGKDAEDVNTALRQLVSKAVSSAGIVDIFSAAGLKTPNISILSDEFLAEVRGMRQKNLALEMLKKLLQDEIARRAKKNLVQARNFAEMLEATMQKYHARLIETTQVIDELIRLAKAMRDAQHKGEALGLDNDEAAFYDVLADNKSARDVLGDAQLGSIARELARSVKQSTTIDWTVRQSVQARIRLMVKEILRKHGYPPDCEEKATLNVLDQAKLLSINQAA